MTNGKNIKKFKGKIIVAVIGGLCTVAAAILGNQHGINSQVKYIQSQVADIDGDGNTVNMNNVDDLVKNYNDLVEDYEQLKNENKKYYEENEKYKEQTENTPTVELKNMGLCINGEDINMNTNNSCAVIDGTDYFSKEFIDNLVNEDISVTIKNETMYLGRIIAEKANLFTQVIIDQSGCKMIDDITDSYGNTYINVLRVQRESNILYNLNKKYSLLKFKLSVADNSDKNKVCTVSIFADDKEVKTIPQIEKTTTHELSFDEISINNCTKLEIRCSGDYYVYPFIYDAEVYN